MSDITRLHNWHHDDYGVAREQIHRMLGDISDIEVWGRQVLVAVYVRPSRNEKTGIYMTTREQKEDWYQGKAVMVLKLGPDAFRGDKSYTEAMFGESGPPACGDWVFAAPNAGIQTSLSGEGASRVKAPDFRGQDIDVFDWDGWPCRIIPDDQFIGRILKPHSVI